MSGRQSRHEGVCLRVLKRLPEGCEEEGERKDTKWRFLKDPTVNFPKVHFVLRDIAGQDVPKTLRHARPIGWQLPGPKLHLH